MRRECARAFLPDRRHIENIVPIAIGMVFTHNLQVHIETITPTPMWSMCLLCGGLTLHDHPWYTRDAMMRPWLMSRTSAMSMSGSFSTLRMYSMNTRSSFAVSVVGV